MILHRLKSTLRVESYDKRAPDVLRRKSFSRLRGQSYALRLALFVLECADLSALWSAATCRDDMLVESLFTECGVKPPQTKAATSRRTPNILMNPTIMKFGGTSVEDA